MKTKITTLLLTLCLVAPGFYVLTIITTSSSPMFHTTDEIYYEANDMFTGDGWSDIADATFNPFWHDLVDKENVPYDGEGVYVAVLDTGLLPFWDYFFDIDSVAWELGKGFTHDFYWDDDVGDIVGSEVRDDRGYFTDYASGHGTHVTSTILGYSYHSSSGNDYWIEGIAPEATIIPVLVLDYWFIDTPFGTVEWSGGTNDMIAAGIYYVANLELDGPVIINMSLGGPNPSQLIEDAINYAISKGVIIVCSAGNEGEYGMGYPGAYDQVISCAMAGWTEMFYNGWTADVPEELDKPDVFGNEYQVFLDPVSSRPNSDLGQKHTDLDVMAPGAWIVGPYKPSGIPWYYYGYYYLMGTSMAAPHVSAIAALCLEIDPTFTQKDIEHIVRVAASGVGKNYDRGFPKTGENVFVYFPFDPTGYYLASWGHHDYGRGFLQADEAVDFALHYKGGHHK